MCMSFPPTEVVDQATSTNDLMATRWRRGEASLYASIRARYQTHGHGRFGRIWEAPRDTALLYSAIVSTSQTPSRLPLSAGVAVIEALDSDGLSLKWPNDVFLHGKKLCGVLAEHIEQQGNTHILVLGIGVNLTACPPGAAKLDRDADALAERITASLPHLDQLFARYTNYLQGVGKSVQAIKPDGETIHGTATGITEEGALVIETPAGITTVTAGDVTLKETL